MSTTEIEVQANHSPALSDLFEGLTRAEQQSLRECERRIDQAANSEQDAGRALTTIQEGKLYRATHRTFETYFEQRFGYGKTYAYRLIKAHHVRCHLAGLPHEDAAERVLRSISESDLDSPDQYRAAWSLAIEKAEGQAPSYSHVRDAVREIAPPRANRTKRERGPSSIPGVQVVTVERMVGDARKAGKAIAWHAVGDDEGTPNACVVVALGTAAVRDLIAGLESMLEEVGEK